MNLHISIKLISIIKLISMITFLFFLTEISTISKYQNDIYFGLSKLTSGFIRLEDISKDEDDIESSIIWTSIYGNLSYEDIISAIVYDDL